MIRIDFEIPSYQRLAAGLAIVSSRLAHLLPEDEQQDETYREIQPVVINRLHRGSTQVATIQPVEIQGEFIPRDDDSSICDDDAASEISAQKQHADAVEMSFQGVEGKSVTGLYGGSGFAPYRWNKKNGNSFFLRVGKHLIWGAELAAQLRRSGAQQGQNISVTFIGKSPVKVLRKIVVDGQQESEWVDTYKNSWEVRVIG